MLILDFEFRLRARLVLFSGQFCPDVLALRASLVLMYWPFGPV